MQTVSDHYLKARLEVYHYDKKLRLAKIKLENELSHDSELEKWQLNKIKQLITQLFDVLKSASSENQFEADMLIKAILGFSSTSNVRQNLHDRLRETKEMVQGESDGTSK
jgi:NAD(P)H-hydrate repair Nnr-like enzyme with NAD(P)H-hydrate epimerase domain